MRPQLLMYAFGIFVVGTLLSLICSGVWFGDSEMGIINALANLNTKTVADMPIPTGIPALISAIRTVLSWNYPYLDHPWGFVFKLFLLYPVSIGVVIGLFELLAAIISGILSAIRSLLPT
jgi:hypothetical protein